MARVRRIDPEDFEPEDDYGSINLPPLLSAALKPAEEQNKVVLVHAQLGGTHDSILSVAGPFDQFQAETFLLALKHIDRRGMIHTLKGSKDSLRSLLES